jgi:hypothetical protein
MDLRISGNFRAIRKDCHKANSGNSLFVLLWDCASKKDPLSRKFDNPVAQSLSCCAVRRLDPIPIK